MFQIYSSYVQVRLYVVVFMGSIGTVEIFPKIFTAMWEKDQISFRERVVVAWSWHAIRSTPMATHNELGVHIVNDFVRDTDSFQKTL